MAQENTKQKTARKEAKPEKAENKPFIYLGPDMVREGLHLTYGMVFKAKPDLPKEVSFLEEWFFEIGNAKELSEKRREIKTPGSKLYKKWFEAKKRLQDLHKKA